MLSQHFSLSATIFNKNRPREVNLLQVSVVWNLSKQWQKHLHVEDTAVRQIQLCKVAFAHQVGQHLNLVRVVRNADKC